MHTKLFAKNRKLHKYATYNSNFETKLLSDMHHRITYMYMNFQQNRVSRSVKTVHTNLFANNRKLHKFATCNTNFEQDAREAMRVVFFCTHKSYLYAQNEISNEYIQILF